MSFIVALLAPKVGELAAKAIVYGIIVLVIVGALAGIRQHYVNLGWNKHAEAVARQDNRAVETNKRVEEQTQKCSDANGYWDVITQGCKIGGDDTVEEKK